MRKADEATIVKVRALIGEAHAKGVDPALLLDRHGMLSYPARTRAMAAQTLSEAAEVLDQMTVRQLAGEDRLASAAADTKRHVVSWLRRSAAEVDAS